MLVVQACVFADDGDALYRLHEPLAALGALPGITAVDIDVFHRDFFEFARKADILIFPYLNLWDFFPLIEERRLAGKRTVFETNDFYDDLHPWNPIAPAWLDPDVSSTHRAFIRSADAIQTSTRFLASYWSSIAKKSVVLPNQLRTIEPIPEPSNGPLTVGWGGSVGHLADWFRITPYLQRWFDSHPQARCGVMTYRHAKQYLRLPDERYDFRDFGSLREYQKFLHTLDVGIAPLLASNYNSGRSDVKFLEYASHGVVGIFAKRGPYSDSVRHGETGFLYDSPEELMLILDELAGNRDLRVRVRKRAYEFVRDHRMLDRHIETRAAFYRSLLDGAAPAELPECLSGYHPFADRAYRLERGPIENAHVAVSTERASSRSVETLEELIRSHPNYFFAYQTLAKFLNDLKRTDECLKVVQLASAICPWSPVIANEEGRARYIRGDIRGALDVFEKTLESNPMFVPGWAYFLRTLKAARAEGAYEPVRDGLGRHHPASVNLRVLALDLIPDRAERAVESAALLEELSRELDPARLLHAAKLAVPALLGSLQHGELLPEEIALLRRASDTFPSSPLILDRLAWALRAVGDHAGAENVFGRIAGMRRSALGFNQEIPPGTDYHLTWLVGEYLNHEDLAPE